MTTPQGAAGKKVVQAAAATRSKKKSTRVDIPPSEQAAREKATAEKRKQQRNTLEGLAFSSAKRFSERHYRRMLIGEFMICVTVTLVDELMRDTTDFSAPNLKPMVGVFIVFFMLAAGTSFGTGPSRLSSAFGGLVTLAIVMKFVKDTTTVENGVVSSKLVDFFKNIQTADDSATAVS